MARITENMKVSGICHEKARTSTFHLIEEAILSVIKRLPERVIYALNKTSVQNFRC